MRTEREFKKEIKEYLSINKKEVTDKIINKKWREYCSEKPGKDDKSLLSTTERPKINIKISNVLKQLVELRTEKQRNPNTFNKQQELKRVGQELKELRLEKKSQKD